jgi:hypothetical protein
MRIEVAGQGQRSEEQGPARQAARTLAQKSICRCLAPSWLRGSTARSANQARLRPSDSDLATRESGLRLTKYGQRLALTLID